MTKDEVEMEEIITEELAKTATKTETLLE